VAEWVRAYLNTLPRAVRVQVYQQLLVDLPADPDNLLGPNIVPFADKFTFQVTAEDQSQHPYRWWFVFCVDRGTPGELHIVSFRETEPFEGSVRDYAHIEDI
jgi:hypothetical protein